MVYDGKSGCGRFRRQLTLITLLALSLSSTAWAAGDKPASTVSATASATAPAAPPGKSTASAPAPVKKASPAPARTVSPAPVKTTAPAPAATASAPPPSSAALPAASAPASVPPAQQASAASSEPSADEAEYTVPEPPPVPSADAAPSAASEVVPPPSASVAAPAPSASAEPAAALSADVKLHDSVVFTLSRGHGTLSAKARAMAASNALDEAFSAKAEHARVAGEGDKAVVYAGSVAVISLYPEDAEAAGSSLDALARSVADRIEHAMREERRRTQIAGTVFSISLVIFFGLIALYVIRKVGVFAAKTRQWTLDNPDRIPAIRLQSLEVIGPAAFRGGILATLVVGRLIAQVGIAYAWVVFTLSLFAATRPLTARLTGFVLTPLSELATRLAASLPLALVAIVSGVAVYVLVRFIQLFFASVARGETQLEWLPAELALPTSALLRGGILVAALVFAAPIVTGDPEGPLARMGSIALLAIGLASTPVLASAVAGVVVVFGRKLHVGHHAEVGGRVGKVIEVGLLEVHLLDEDGCDVRVPHLLSLFHPTRSLGRFRRMTIEVRVDANARPADVRRLLLDVAARYGENVTVDLAEVDAKIACYRVRAALGSEARAGDLRAELVEALKSADIELAAGERQVGVA